MKHYIISLQHIFLLQFLFVQRTELYRHAINLIEYANNISME